MAARWVRRVVVAVCAAAVVTMIVASAVGSTGGAITAGLVTVAAIIALVLVTAVAGEGAFGAPSPPDEAAAADVERRIGALVAAGADEAEVRSLVRAVGRLYRSGRHAPTG